MVLDGSEIADMLASTHDCHVPAFAAQRDTAIGDEHHAIGGLSFSEQFVAVAEPFGGESRREATQGVHVEFTERGDAKGSVSAFVLSGDFEVQAGFGTGLKANLEAAVTEAVAPLKASVEGYKYRTVIMLLDTLSGNAE